MSKLLIDIEIVTIEWLLVERKVVLDRELCIEIHVVGDVEVELSEISLR